MIKRIIFVLLLASLLCGATSATPLTISVYDAANNNPISGAEAIISELNTTSITDSNGVVKFSVNASTMYTLSVSKNGYIPIINRSVSSFEYYIDIPLTQEAPVAVRVVDPSGNPVVNAHVFVDNEDAGFTNSAGIVRKPMKRNAPHEIYVSADLFDDYRESKYIYSGDSAYIVNLKKSEVVPRIYVVSQTNVPVSGAEITIDNGKAFYTGDNGKAELTSKYAAGTHSLKVVKDGYEVYQSEILINTNTGDITAKLNYSAVLLTITVIGGDKPLPEAIVYVNDKAEGITDTYGMLVVKQLPGTVINLSASHEGYSSEKVSYNVSSAQDQKTTIHLSADAPLALIIGIVAGVIIVILAALLVIVYRSRNNQSNKFNF